MILLNVHTPLITSLLIVLVISIFFILIVRRLKLPSVIGFLLAGAISGVTGLNLHALLGFLPADWAAPLYETIPKYITPPEDEVNILAEIGVILLMFTIGLEFSISNIVRLKKPVLVGGTLQVLVTVFIFALCGYFYYEWFPIALFVGFLFTLSSTAIVLKLLQESGDINKPYGQITLAILLFQDIAVVPMMLIIPILMGGEMEVLASEIAFLILKLGVLVAFVFALARFIMPFVLFQIVKAQSKDLFVVSVVCICFIIAFITDQIGLSLELGAFLAGLIISESKYSHQVVGAVIYFKELFTSIFFISVGLMLNLYFLRENWLLVLAFTFLVIFMKGAIALGVAFMLNRSPRVAISVAIAVSQLGEFSFILARVGEKNGIMAVELAEYFTPVAVFTMILSPVLIYYTNPILNWLSSSHFVPSPIRNWIEGTPEHAQDYNIETKGLTGHIVIIGSNLTTHSIAYGAKEMKIPYVIIEQDPEVVEKEYKRGEPIIYGDASNEEVLLHAHIDTCDLVVIASNTLRDMDMCLSAIRHVNSTVYIITRTYNAFDAKYLEDHGANVVVSDDIQSNVEILVHVLDHLNLPVQEAYKFTEYIRTEAIHESDDERNAIHKKGSKFILQRWVDWVRELY